MALLDALPRDAASKIDDQLLLGHFMPKDQLQVMIESAFEEEGDFFAKALSAMAARIRGMPETYAQDGLGEKAVAHLHYFIGGCDWYITEKDAGDGSGDPGQYQAFGLACLNGGEPEMGYISIAEIIECGGELDLHFEPTTIAECRATLDSRRYIP